MKRKNSRKIKESRGDRIFGITVYAIVIFLVLLCAYPLYLVVINSFSDPALVARGQIYIIPKGFTLDAYIKAFTDSDIMRGYANSLFYTVVGTALNMLLTIPAAYALSKPKVIGRGVIMKLIVFTMYFSGGLVPHFILMRSLHLLNTWWAIPITGAVNATNLIIARTFFISGIPAELEDAAEVDGCTTLQCFLRVVLPLSKAMLSVILLYYAVARWNNYTSALYYLPMAQDKYPLQMVLRQLLITMQRAAAAESSELQDYYANLANQLKYAAIVIASVPLLVIYPFIQKYFEKGVMLGSVKG